MAQKVQVLLVDDLDGSEATETVSFGLDGVSYEMASLACCGIGPSFGAFESLGLGAFDTVLITGLGPATRTTSVCSKRPSA